MKPLYLYASSLATVLAISTPAGATTFFRADLDGAQVVPATPSMAGGTATFELNDDQTELFYFIQLTGVNLKEDIADRTAPNDVNKMHLHVASPGQNGPHVLNIFGLPGEDDADLVVDFAANTLTGIWDDSDVSDLNANGIADPNDSKPLTNFVDALQAGDIYLQVHTLAFDQPTGFPGELRGQLMPQMDAAATPEPSLLFGLVALGAWHLKQRRSAT